MLAARLLGRSKRRNLNRRSASQRDSHFGVDGQRRFCLSGNMLFFDTIEENIRMGNKTATFEEVARAACAAQCHEFIESLPNGYQTW